MFAPFTPLDKCIGKEVTVKVMDGNSYMGMLSGVYVLNGQTVLVIQPLRDGGSEQHIPLAVAVVTVKAH